MINIKSDYYPNWTANRINFIHQLYPKKFFKNKRVLELAPCRGDIGAYFSSLGANVVLLEGRIENVSAIQRIYPHLNVKLADLDTPEWNWGEFDIIVNFGLYYHLHKHHKEHLINCINNSKLMFFESVIFDSVDSKIVYRKENGFDQSLNGVGGTPTTSYVEGIFNECNVTYTKYTSHELNSGLHHYDWVDENTEIFDQFSRRIWVIEND